MRVVYVVVPGDADGACIKLVERDRDVGVWGGSRSGTPGAFGTVAEVVAALSSRPGDDPRVAEVAAALDREMLTHTNHVGLCAEQISRAGQQQGNFPQALTTCR